MTLTRSLSVRAEAAIELFRTAAPVDYDQLRHDLDRSADQIIVPHA